MAQGQKRTAASGLKPPPGGDWGVEYEKNSSYSCESLEPSFLMLVCCSMLAAWCLIPACCLMLGHLPDPGRPSGVPFVEPFVDGSGRCSINQQAESKHASIRHQAASSKQQAFRYLVFQSSDSVWENCPCSSCVYHIPTFSEIWCYRGDQGSGQRAGKSAFNKQVLCVRIFLMLAVHESSSCYVCVDWSCFPCIIFILGLTCTCVFRF